MRFTLSGDRSITCECLRQICKTTLADIYAATAELDDDKSDSSVYVASSKHSRESALRISESDCYGAHLRVVVFTANRSLSSSILSR